MTRSQSYLEYYSEDLFDAFDAGAKWADTHPTKKQVIWHNANETSSENSKIVIIDIDGNVFNYTHYNENFEQVVEINDIVI